MSHRTYFDVFEDASGGYRWHLISGNGKIVAQGESHTRPADAWRAAHDLGTWAKIADFSNES